MPDQSWIETLKRLQFPEQPGAPATNGKRHTITGYDYIQALRGGTAADTLGDTSAAWEQAKATIVEPTSATIPTVEQPPPGPIVVPDAMAEPVGLGAPPATVPTEQAEVLRAEEEGKLRAASERIAASSAELRARASEGFEKADEPGRLGMVNAERAVQGLAPAAALEGPAGFLKTVGQEFGTAKGLTQKIPYAGAIATAADLWGVYHAAERAANGTARADDWSLLADFQDELVDAARGKTFGGTVASIASQSLPFMGEFMAANATLGLGATATAATTGAKAAGKAAALAALKKGVTAAAVSLATVPLIATPHVMEGTIRRALPEFVVERPDIFSEKGDTGAAFNFVALKPGEDPRQALKNATYDSVIEVVSESSGALLGFLVKPFTAGAKGVIRASGFRAPSLTIGAKGFLERLKSAGYHGPVTEMLEERTGELGREAVTRAGLADLPQEVPSAEQVGAELAAFSIPVAVAQTPAVAKSAWERIKGLFRGKRKPGEGIDVPGQPPSVGGGLEIGAGDVVGKPVTFEDEGVRDARSQDGGKTLPSEGKGQGPKGGGGGQEDQAEKAAQGNQLLTDLRRQLLELTREQGIAERAGETDRAAAITERMGALTERMRGLTQAAATGKGDRITTPPQQQSTETPAGAPAESPPVAAPPVAPDPDTAGAPDVSHETALEPPGDAQTPPDVQPQRPAVPVREEMVLARRLADREEILTRNREAMATAEPGTGLYAVLPEEWDEREIPRGTYIGTEETAGLVSGNRPGTRPRPVTVDLLGVDWLQGDGTGLFKAAVALTRGEDETYRPLGYPTEATDPDKALVRYRAQRGYTHETDPAFLATDVIYTRLKGIAKEYKRIMLGRESGTGKVKKLIAPEQAAGEAAEGRVTRESIPYVKQGQLPWVIRELIQIEAGIQAQDAESDATRKWLEQIAGGYDVGPGGEAQIDRIVAILLGEVDQRSIWAKGIIGARPVNAILETYMMEPGERQARIEEALLSEPGDGNELYRDVLNFLFGEEAPSRESVLSLLKEMRQLFSGDFRPPAGSERSILEGEEVTPNVGRPTRRPKRAGDRGAGVEDQKLLEDLSAAGLPASEPEVSGALAGDGGGGVGPDRGDGGRGAAVRGGAGVPGSVPAAGGGTAGGGGVGGGGESVEPGRRPSGRGVDDRRTPGERSGADLPPAGDGGVETPTGEPRHEMARPGEGGGEEGAEQPPQERERMEGEEPADQPAGEPAATEREEPGDRGGGAATTGGAGEREPGTPSVSEPDAQPGTEPTAAAEPVLPISADLVDHVIGPEDVTFPKGTKTRIRANFTALELSQKIESEGRQPTQEERLILAQYTSFASAREMFNKKDPTYQAERDRLLELVGQEAYDSAAAASLNAMFTSPEIVRAMYTALERIGYAGRGSVVEPSAGIGHFFGAMPQDVAGRVRRVAVELDVNAGRILKLLYPKVDTRITGFEQVRLPNDSFDLVVGNFPFGSYEIFDPRYPKGLTQFIHDYFFARSIDLVRPGSGIVAAITSSGTMNKLDSGVRRALAAKADLIGAIRLNQESLPGTKVTADILFLRRRAEGEEPAGEAWTDSVEVEVDDGDGGKAKKFINEYFDRHPEMVLGRLQAGSLYGSGEGPTAVVVMPDPAAPTLEQAIENLPFGVVDTPDPISQSVRDRAADMVPIGDDMPEGTYRVHKGRLHKVTKTPEGNVLRPLPPPESKAEEARRARMADAIKIRDAVLELMRAQLESEESDLAEMQAKLNKVYDTYVRLYSTPKTKAFLSASVTQRDWADDSYSRAILSSVENWDRKAKIATKKEIFTRRILNKLERPDHAESLGDAVQIALDETGTLELARIAELRGISEEAALAGLLTEGLAYEVPGGGLESSADYLSGDVRQKLEEARSAAESDYRFQRNVEALALVIPKDLGPADIRVNMGATWIPAEVYEEFTKHMLGWPGKMKIAYIRETGRWVTTRGESYRDNAHLFDWGTQRRGADKLIDDALNGRIPVIIDTDEEGNKFRNETATVAAQVKLQKIVDEFARWIWDDGARIDRLIPAYNREFNSHVPWKGDGKHLTFPGMNPLWRERFYPHQRSAVHRIIASPQNVLVFHPMGSGKTASYVAAGMEAKRLGKARFSVIVVYSTTFEQFAREAQTMYPTATILAISAQTHGAGEPRFRAYADIAAGAYDLVIMPHQFLKQLPMKPETMEQFYNEQLQELIAAFEQADDSDDSTVKELENAIKRLKTKIAKLRDKADKAKIQGLYWEDLFHGAYLFYDESQKGKNLPYNTTKARVKGMGNPQGSVTAFDLMMKTSWMNRVNGGRGVIFGSGTPVANSMVELYSVMKYLIPGKLKALGINHVDAWLSQFGVISEDVERAVEGVYKNETRLRYFTNLGDLLRMYYGFSDVLTEEQLDKNLKKPRPIIAKNSEGERTWENIISPTYDALQAFMKRLANTGKWIKENFREARERGINYLVITRMARMAGVDMRLISRRYPEHPQGKLFKVAENVHKLWVREAPRRGVQLIFSEQGQNTKTSIAAGRFISYLDLVEKLVERGVPRDEIAIVQDHSKDREDLFRRVNAGEVRILIGSLAGLGVGVNVQQRAFAIHLVDPPWRPDEVAQGIARALRPGNTYTEVELYRYGQESSGDEMLFSKLFQKMRFLKQQLTDGDFSIRQAEEEDLEAITEAEMQALVAENPHIGDMYKAEAKARKLAALERDHINTQASARQKIHAYSETNKRVEKGIEQRRSVVKTLDRFPDFLPVTIDHKEYDSHKEAGAAIIKQLNDVEGLEADEVRRIGTVRSFPLIATFIDYRRTFGKGNKNVRGVRLHLDTGVDARTSDEETLLEYESQVGVLRINADPTGVARRVENLAKGVGDVLLASERDLKFYTKEIAEAEKRLGPFPQVAELAAAAADVVRVKTLVKEHQEASGFEATAEGGVPTGDLLDVIEQMRAEKRDAERKAKEEDEDTGEGEEGTPPAGGSAGKKGVRFGKRRERMFPETLNEDQEFALAKLRGEGRPAFAMGAALNIPSDDAGWWKRMHEAWRGMWDNWIEKLENLKPTHPLYRSVRAIGMGVYGRSWGLPEHVNRAFERFRGRTSGGVTETAEDVREERRKAIGKVIELIGPGGDAAANDMLNKGANGELHSSTMPEVLQGLHRRTRDIMRSLGQELLDVIDASAEPEAIERMGGLANWRAQVQRKLDDPDAYYLRTLFFSKADFVKDTSFGRTVEVRNVGPRIKQAMFKPKRSEKGTPFESWMLFNNGVATAYYTPEDAWEAKAELEPAARKEHGESWKEFLYIQEPFGEETRGELREINNWMYRVVRTIAEMTHTIESLRLFNYLYDLGASLSVSEFVEDYLPDTGEEAREERSLREAWTKEGFAKLPDNPLFGPLANRLVPRPIYDNLTEVREIRTDVLARIYRAWYGAWKSIMIGYSPRTWTQNAVGVLSSSWVYRGMNPVTDLKWLRRAIQEAKSRGKHFRALVDENIIRTAFDIDRIEYLVDDLALTEDPDAFSSLASWIHAEAADRLKQLGIDEKSLAMKNQTAKEVARKAKAVHNAIMHAYGAADRLGILAAYLKDVEGAGLSHEAAVKRLWAFPEAHDSGLVSKWLAKVPFGGPFARWFNRFLVASLRAAKEHPMRVIALHALPGVFHMLSVIIAGIDDDEMDLMNADMRRQPTFDGPVSWIRSLMPKAAQKYLPTSVWNYFNPALPWRDHEGRAQFTGLSMMFPLANVTRLDLGDGINLPFFWSTPFTGAMTTLVYGIDRFGRKAVDEKEGEGLGALLWETLKYLTPVPSILSRGMPRMVEAWKGESEDGFIKTMMSEVYGLSASAPRISRESLYKLILQRYGEGHVDGARRIIELWNSQYRGKKGKPVTAQGITSAIVNQKRREMKKAEE